MGLRLLAGERVTLRIDLREHAFESELLGRDETTYHAEFTAGVGMYF